MNKKYWFKRRRYGWGWCAVTWQGWTIFWLFIAIVIGGAWLLRDAPEDSWSPELGRYLLLVVVASLLLILAAYLKGPKPKWRWGAKPDDNPEEDA